MTHPQASIEVGTETIDVTAKLASPEERERLWQTITTQNPAFKEYEDTTPRTIPVVVLKPSVD